MAASIQASRSIRSGSTGRATRIRCSAPGEWARPQINLLPCRQFAGRRRHLYRTLDGGKSWAQVNWVRVGADRWTTRGLDVTTNYDVHFDPFDPKHIFIDYTDIGAFRSFDGGASWQTATTGVPDRWRNTTYWLELDPQVKDLVWGAFSGVHDLPRPKIWNGRDPASWPASRNSA